jgi:hypothetical protein
LTDEITDCRIIPIMAHGSETDANLRIPNLYPQQHEMLPSIINVGQQGITKDGKKVRR